MTLHITTDIVARRREKPIDWVGSTLNDLRAFPEEARKRAGFELHQVPIGLEPSDWKPMPAVGPSVSEIRIQTGREHRIFYVAHFPEAVYVLHAFEKKAAKTRRTDIELARQRYAEIRRARRRSQA